ncbi:glucose 1-dehydrogenase [Flavobacterium sp. MFBS3-15]|uniref:SDR family NAD(P)-dependent oxidoreductase n=1 Tax=Flavobacterium sp. MFBS3-15 TaxID=2989816 RepID=UPI0022368A20|nr:glucose 1-dehydrogenase [Flavobacterium sp. MFBS3-15]MCW4468372.1 glucose 1-dehydrogenase [Flavobacterium sp. MFBS3-15]
MSLKLSGKVALVTGASKGIGSGIAKSLAAAGAAVVVNYASDKEGADKTVSQIQSDGGKAIALQGKADNESDVKRIFDETIKTYGRLDILVNNAGIYRFNPLEEIGREEFEAQFNTNVYAPILTSKEAVKHFGEAGGSIINIGSIASRTPVVNSSVYSATKGALDTLTQVLALELAPKNIRVNVVAPGPVETEGTHAAGLIGSDLEKNLVAMTPLGRIGQPNDIATIVTFLASDESAWLTGERISAGGGMR